jgi:hypothetical protein
LVIRHILQLQFKKDDIDHQKENIFHTCYAQNKVCSLIIDRENYVNIASIILVSKLNKIVGEHLASKHHGHYRL